MDDTNSRTVEYHPVKAIKGYFGHVTWPCTALAAYNDYYASKAAKLAKNANMNVVSDSYIKPNAGGQKR